MVLEEAHRYVGSVPSRYAVDASKIERDLGWRPLETFDTGIRKTVQWYLDHPDWVASVQSGAYTQWVDTNYGART